MYTSYLLLIDHLYKNKKIVSNLCLLLQEVVDFRSRMLAFRGACGEPPKLFKPAGVSPVPLIPQESRTLRSNQQFSDEHKKTTKKETAFIKEPKKKSRVTKV
jgi:hypothetical protein